MKRNVFPLIAISFVLLVSVNLSAQKETRKVGPFSKVGLSIAGDLYLTQANETSVVIEASSSDLEKIRTEVENGVLKIKTKPGTWRLGDVKVYVTNPEFEKIAISGSGDAYAKETIKSDDINLSVSGSGDIHLKDLQAKETEINISGSGDVKIAGKSTEEVGVSIAGSGDVDASEFETEKAKVRISGSGSAKIWAVKELDTKIAGSGKVYYKGNPVIDASSSGSGRTVQM